MTKKQETYMAIIAIIILAVLAVVSVYLEAVL